MKIGIFTSFQGEIYVENIEVPTIDAIIRWSQEIRNERIIDDNNRLILDSKDLSAPLKAGIPCYYGYKTIEDMID